MKRPGRLRGGISGMVQCQILIRAAVLGRLRLLSSQYFSWAVLTHRELVPLSRIDTLELAMREDVQPTGVVELHDLVLEEAAVTPNPIHISNMSSCYHIIGKRTE